MNVLSLFDGMSCGQIALNRIGIKYDNYFASEIDKYAIKVTQSNYPNTIQLGNVLNVKGYDLPKIDLLIGGSPCQGFSFASKLQLNFEDPRSKLFFEFVRLLKETNPKYFLLENVKMKKQFQDIISSYLGVEPIKINSALVSAQNRERLYWTNIPNVQQPEDRGIMLKDITEDNSNQIAASRGRYILDDAGNKTSATKQQIELRPDNKSNTLTTIPKDNIILIENCNSNVGLKLIGRVDKSERWASEGKNFTGSHKQNERIFSVEGKSPTLCANSGNSKGPGNAIVSDDHGVSYRKLTPIECERLQTVPDNYTNYVSSNQRHRMLGNGWTVSVISHIFSFMK